MSHKLHLLLPKFPIDTDSIPDLDNFSLLTSRAKKTTWSYQNIEVCLFNLFGFNNQNLPIAAMTYLIDGEDFEPNRLYLRADPVYLQADRDRVLLFDAETALQDVTLDEAQQLAAILNQHFAEDGLYFLAPTPTRWYLKLADDVKPRLELSSLSEVKGADVHDYMPAGADRLQWRSYLNEIQMLLYQNSINETREAQGKLPINSVWFWGMGQSAVLPNNNWSHVWSQQVLATGLAKASQVPYSVLPAQFEQILQQTGEQLVVFAKPQNGQFLQDLDNFWLKPALNALRQHQIDELILYTEKGIFSLNSRQLGHWWKRKRDWKKNILLAQVF